jgi:hypothetical protein
VVCHIPLNVREGDQIKATYDITSNLTTKVGLGAGIYDDGASDYANGYGDMDGYLLESGTTSVTRDIRVPADLPVGRYEIVAEIWPAGEIGADNTEVLAEATCGYFDVA